MKKMKFGAMLLVLAVMMACLTACGLPQIPQDPLQEITFLPQENILPLAAAPVIETAAPEVPAANVPSSEPSAAQPPATQPAPATLTLEQAKALVFAKLNVTEDQLTHKEYGFDDGAFELEFRLGNTEYEFKVHAATGQITQISSEIKPAPAQPTQQAQPPATQPAPATLTLEQAKALVFAKLNVTEKQITDADFDCEDGKFELEFQIGNIEYDFEVSSTTGEILKSEWEYDD